jgi:hypothetical protein
LAGLQRIYRERWQESAAVSGPDAGNAPYWAMHWERITELLELIDTPRGKIAMAAEKLLQEPDGDPKAKYKALQRAFSDWLGQLHQEALLGCDTNPDEDERKVMVKVQVEMLRTTNEFAKAEIPNLRQKFLQVAQQRGSGTLKDRENQRGQLVEIMTGSNPYKNDGKPQKGRDPSDPDDLFPHDMLSIISIRLGVERQAQLLGGSLMFLDPSDSEATAEYERHLKALEETVGTASREYKSLMVEEARQGLEDAKRRIGSLSRLTAEERKKEEAMLSVDLGAAATYILGMERQRQLLGGEEGKLAPIFGIDMSFGQAGTELVRISREAEAIFRQWKGSAASSGVGADWLESIVKNAE